MNVVPICGKDASHPVWIESESDDVESRQDSSPGVQSNGVQSNGVQPPGGTLLWIGDHEVSEFRSAYQYCVHQMSQIAPRRNLLEAVKRPAADVRAILLARDSRQSLNQDVLQALRRLYPEARWMDLLGPLCEGIRQSSIADSRRVAWHRWDQFVPELLHPERSSGSKVVNQSKRGKVDGKLDGMDDHVPDSANCVAVVASDFDIAESYLDLAEANGVTAVWCRTPDSLQVRNMHTIWWDDSVANATSPDLWRRRVAMFQTKGRLVRHAWITHTAWLDQRQFAIEGGIDTIISKPFRNETLLDTLCGRGRAISGYRWAA